MVNYNCIRCGYTTNDKSKMKSHFRRKTVCKPELNDVNIDEYKKDILEGKKITIITDHPKSSQIIPNHPKSSQIIPNHPESSQIFFKDESSFFECKYCEKRYKHNYHLNRHLKKCKEKKEDDEEKKNLLNLVEILNKQLNEQREEHKKQLSEQNNQINELIKKTGINIGTQNNIQNNIKILAFKNTDISHLTDQDYIQCLNRSNMCIPNLIKRIHFDPKKPENHNIYISNIRNKYIMVYDGMKWILHDQSDAIDNLIDTNEFVLEQKLEEWLENGKNYPDIMNKFNRYLEKKEKDDVLNKIKEEIKLILYNNRKIIDCNSIE